MGGITRDLNAIDLQRGASISTMTACFRNVFEELPVEVLCSGQCDVFWWSLLGHYGKGKYLGDIKPSKYRVHEGGIFSMKPKKHRLHMRQITSNAPYAYYNRIGNTKLANHFLGRGLRTSVAILGIFPIFKKMIKKYFKYKA